MKILIATTFFPPENSIASHRPYSFAKFWTRLGHEVTVLTCPASKGSSIIDLPREGFEVIEVALPQFFQQAKEVSSSSSFSYFNEFRKKTGAFSRCRMPDLADLWVRLAYKKIQKRSWDWVLTTSGPYSVHWLGQRLKKEGKGRIWSADYRDLWTDHQLFPGVAGLRWIEKWLEKKWVGGADFITTVSRGLQKKLQEKFIEMEVHLIENGFDDEILEELKSDPIFLKGQKLRIVHTGSFYPGKVDPTPLFQAIRELEPDDHLELIFVGPNLSLLQPIIDSYRVNRWVKCLGFVDWKTSLQMQMEASLLLFLPWGEATSQGILTGKLFEYLFSKRPIMAIGSETMEESQELIKKCGSGFLLGRDVEKIVTFLRAALQQKKVEITPNQELLRTFSRKHLAQKLISLCEARMTK